MNESLQAHEIQKGYCASLNQLADKMDAFLFLGKHVHALRHVAGEVVQPFNVAVFGRMKTGKSSLINAMIGHSLAITGVEEATATINRLSYADGEQLNSFKVHWKDAQPESFPLEQLQSGWNGKDPDVLKRIQRTAFLELFSNVPRLKDIHIIDTPGTGSTAAEHEIVAQQFISGQETDALVYVFSPVGRETDEDALSEFCKTCLTGSDPYNSVAVLHKWDHIYWDNGGDMDDIGAKAARLRERMKDKVADVLPVSAPLALLTKVAPDSFWENCLKTLAKYTNEGDLCYDLEEENDWGCDTERRQLYMQAHTEFSLPWPSFQITLRELFRKRPVDALAARAIIRKLSGFDGFESMLDQRFFKQQAVIRLRNTRKRAQDCLNEAYLDIEHKKETDGEKLETMERIASEIHSPDLKNWLESEIGQWKIKLHDMHVNYLNIDKERFNIKNSIEKEDAKVELTRWLSSPDAAPFAKISDLLLKTIEADQLPEDIDHENLLFDTVAGLTQSPTPIVRSYADKILTLLHNLP